MNTIVSIEHWNSPQRETVTSIVDAGVGNVTVEFDGPDYGTLRLKGPEINIAYERVQRFYVSFKDKQ